MALVVEDGTGLSTAESYVSVTDATTYHTAHGAPTSWTNATTAAKESALRLATQYLDVTYGLSWQGERIVETMALDWPRYHVVDSDGFYVPANSVPQGIKDACSVLALKSIDGDTLIPDVTAGTNISSESVTVGPITTSKSYSGDKGVTKRYRLVEMLVADYIGGGGGKLYRA